MEFLGIFSSGIAFHPFQQGLDLGPTVGGASKQVAVPLLRGERALPLGLVDQRGDFVADQIADDDRRQRVQLPTIGGAGLPDIGVVAGIGFLAKFGGGAYSLTWSMMSAIRSTSISA